MSRDRVEIVAAGVKRRGLMEWDNNVRWIYWKIALEYSFFLHERVVSDLVSNGPQKVW